MAVRERTTATLDPTRTEHGFSGPPLSVGDIFLTGDATAAAGSAAQAAAYAAAANATLGEFKGIYYGPLSAPPATDPDGSPSEVGDLFYRTTAPVGLHYYTGSTWLPVPSVTNSQPLDATLTALAGLDATLGLIEQTGLDVFTKRTVGIANPTSLPTLNDADLRYAAKVHNHPVTEILNFGDEVNKQVAGPNSGTRGLLVPGTNVSFTYDPVIGKMIIAAAPGATEVAPGNKGEISVSPIGDWTINNTAVTYAKIQNISTQFRLLGRTTGPGAIEEIPTSAAGVSFLAAANLTAQKTLLGINNVDNTSDANKPISTATATALAGKAPTTHSHAMSDITGLNTALTTHTHTTAQVTGLDTALAGKAALTGAAFSGSISTTGNIAAASGAFTAYGWGGNNNVGVLFLNSAQSRYLIFDGSNYAFAGANLYVNGGIVYHSGNFNPASYLPLGGGTVIGGMAVNVNTAAAPLTLYNPSASFGAAEASNLGLYGDQPHFTMLRPGILGIKFGLRNDNQVVLGGWSWNANAFVFNNGNLSCAGHITAGGNIYGGPIGYYLFPSQSDGNFWLHMSTDGNNYLTFGPARGLYYQRGTGHILLRNATSSNSCIWYDSGHQYNAGGYIMAGGGLYSNGRSDFGLYEGGARRYMSFQGGWYWDWDTTNGNLRWIGGNSEYMSIAPGGALWMQSDSTLRPNGGPWQGFSDARIKTVVGDYEHGLAEILTLQPIRFQYRGNDTRESVDDAAAAHDAQQAAEQHRQNEAVKMKREPGGGNVNKSPKMPISGAPEFSTSAPYSNSPHYQSAVAETEYIGLIAQDVEGVLPEIIQQHEGYIDDEPVTDLRTMDTGPLTFALINAVKELASRVSALEG